MRTYENKDELKNEINKSFAKYISEFNDIPEHLKDKRIDEIDRTPAENLAYQVGWTTLVIKWESDERKGIPVKTPSDNFKWNQLGELYQWFTDTYAQLSLQELKDRLNENINSIYAMIDSLSDEELFKPHMRKWADEATKTAVWERIVDQMKQAQGITEQLKAENQMEWVVRMNNIQTCAREAVNAEVIYN